MFKRLALIVILFNICIAAKAGVLQGLLTDVNDNPIPYANVYVKNSTYGVSTNLRGEFFMELSRGTHIICFSSVGFETVEREVAIQAGVTEFIHVRLSIITLDAIEIVDNRREMAQRIMRNVRDNRRRYLNSPVSYTCNTYVKTSIERELVRYDSSDTMTKTDTIIKGTGRRGLFRKRENTSIADTLIIEMTAEMRLKPRKEIMSLLETFTRTHFRSPGSYKEDVIAYRDYVTKRRYYGPSASIGGNIGYGEYDIAPLPQSTDNPYILYSNVRSSNMNFYSNLIDYPAICQKPLVSPLAVNSALYYTFDYQGSFIEDGHTVYEIYVRPLFPRDALFEGSLFIQDSSWAIKAVDFKINSAALFYCSEFRIIQNYENIEGDSWLPVRREMIYTIKDGKHDILGNSRIRHTNYILNPVFPPRFFNNEIKTFEVDAFEKDSSFWEEVRPLSLQESEIVFINYNDSLANYYTSAEFYSKADSSFNAITWWVWLTGIGHRNRARGTEWYLEGIFGQINPFGIGGYRHRLPGYFKKEFSNDMLLETRGFIDYGFRNRDIKGKLGVGLTYYPLRFVRTFVQFGDYYEMINSYASLTQAFSRSNYVRTRTFSVAQRMEVVNGLYGELTFAFSDQDPLTNLQMDEWSEKLFGSINEPTDFVRYKKSEIKLEMLYRIKQRYVIRKNKKVIIGSDYPEFMFIYRKGIPGLLNSEVNYDYVELRTRGDIKPARLGTTRWEAQAGSFVNKKNLRVLEHKYFRGSDRFFFSDPLRSFQLMDYAFNTPNEYLRANFIHHFEGTFMNKIPVLNLLKLELAVGAGTLIIPDSDFAHFEMFVGFERVFRIKKQLFRFGVYGVSSDNTFDKTDFTIKFGLDFFNSYTNKWSY